MPVRFHCPACHQYLGVSRRKIGSFVTCPKCQISVLVPDDEPERDAAGQGSEMFSAADRVEIIAFDDIAAVLGSTPAVTTAAGPAADAAIDRRFVAVSRRTLYVQAGLIVVVCLAAFVAGYFTGRGARAPEVSAASQKPVEVQGRASYQNDGGAPQADAQAAIVVFPKGVKPAEKIPIERLSPDEPAPGDDDVALQAIEASGGIYRRADEQGQFEFRVRPGVYQVLVISRHMARPPGSQPKSKDLIALGGYFRSAPDLLGSHRYDLSERRLPEESPLNYTFGAGR